MRSYYRQMWDSGIEMAHEASGFVRYANVWPCSFETWDDAVAWMREDGDL